MDDAGGQLRVTVGGYDDNLEDTGNYALPDNVAIGTGVCIVIQQIIPLNLRENRKKVP